LSKPTDSIEKPKPLPAGTYNGVISKYEFGESKEKKTPYVRYHLTAHSAGEDVDPDSIEGIDLSKKSLRRDFYLTEDAMYRVKDFLDSVGVSTSGRSLGEVIPEAINAAVLISVTQRSSPDGSEIYNDVGNVVGA
jgi:hypothetical protein